MKNVLDQLKKIAETNDSEDVARAIGTVSSHQREVRNMTFKDRLALAETRDGFDADGNYVGSEHQDPDRDEDEQQFSDEDLDSVSETPGGDGDQYCALCGNTGYRLDTRGEPCPNCGEGEYEQGEHDKGNREPANEDGMDGVADAWGRIADRVSTRDEGGNRPPDDTQASDGPGNDPWGIGEGEDEGFDADTDPDSEDMGYDASASVYGGADDDDLEEGGQEGSALERVQARAQRSGDGGPLDRLHSKKEEKYAALEEEMGRVFQTPMERHSWIMNQLNNMTGDMTPEDASMVKQLLKTAGNADVKGGNC